jgi:hypothetical protein
MASSILLPAPPSKAVAALKSILGKPLLADSLRQRLKRFIKGRPSSIGGSSVMEGAVCMNSKKYVGMDVH